MEYIQVKAIRKGTKDFDQRIFIQLIESDEDRQSSDKFRRQAEFHEILRSESSELLRQGHLFMGSRSGEIAVLGGSVLARPRL